VINRSVVIYIHLARMLASNADPSLISSPLLRMGLIPEIMEGATTGRHRRSSEKFVKTIFHKRRSSRCTGTTDVY